MPFLFFFEQNLKMLLKAALSTLFYEISKRASIIRMFAPEGEEVCQERNLWETNVRFLGIFAEFLLNNFENNDWLN